MNDNSARLERETRLENAEEFSEVNIQGKSSQSEGLVLFRTRSMSTGDYTFFRLDTTLNERRARGSARAAGMAADGWSGDHAQTGVRSLGSR